MTKWIAMPFALLFIVAATVAADDWGVSTGGKPGRYGLSREHGPVAETLLWHTGVSAVIAHPVVIEGQYVAMDRIQNISDVLHGTRIVVQNLATGDTLWTRDLPVDFPSTDWRNRVSALRGGRVYATRSGNTNASYLYALDVTNGFQIWKSDSLIDESSTEGVSFASDGDIVVGNFGSIMRIDAADGSTVWKRSRSSPTSDGSSVAVYNDRGYAWEATGSGPTISVYDLATGVKRYASPGLGGLVQQVAPFVGPDGTIYAPRTQNNVSTDYLVAFRDTDSSLVELWRVPLGYVPFASFGIGPDGSVYSYSRSNRVIRIDHLTGMVTDSSIVALTDYPAQPRMATDTTGLVFLTNGGFTNGRLFSFNPDLSLRWSSPVTNVNIGGPAIGSGGILIVAGVGTDVRAYHTGIAVAEPGPRRPLMRIGVLRDPEPNPCRERVRLAFDLRASVRVELAVHDLSGRRVRTLFSGPASAGLHRTSWDGRDAQGHLMPGGVYLAVLNDGQAQHTKKIVWLE